MRIVGGLLCGRRIPVPGRGVRPTPARVREALMSILGPAWEERSVLDCFAGSGALGFEASSRGASRVVFVDHDEAACRRIRATAAELGLLERTRVLRADAARAMARLAQEGERFDVLFFDPPYGFSALRETLTAALSIAGPDATLVAELRAGPAPSPDGLRLNMERHYGGTTVALYVPEVGPKP